MLWYYWWMIPYWWCMYMWEVLFLPILWSSNQSELLLCGFIFVLHLLETSAGKGCPIKKYNSSWCMNIVMHSVLILSTILNQQEQDLLLKIWTNNIRTTAVWEFAMHFLHTFACKGGTIMVHANVVSISVSITPQINNNMDCGCVRIHCELLHVKENNIDISWHWQQVGLPLAHVRVFSTATN